jgi:lipoprotein NlpI
LKRNATNLYGLEFKGIALLYLQKNATVALDIFNKILQTRPVAAWALDNKGIALAELGNYTDALSTLNAALALDPRYEYAFYNKALVLIEPGLHTQNLGDMGAVAAVADRG